MIGGGGVGGHDDDTAAGAGADRERGARYACDERCAAQIHPLAEVELEPERVGQVDRPERIGRLGRRGAGDEPVDSIVVERGGFQKLGMHVAREVENAAPARHGVGGLGEADDERFVLVQVIASGCGKISVSGLN